ncbi:protein kinase [Nonomuraea sp. NPDC046570]|uniref:serine/threonine-protein kinase n=1 Tax=Nonomuraea sp. NPDC046570 TaxID=3155255 RepID=UPI0033D9CEE0
MVPGYREVRQLGAGRTGRVFLATYQATGAYVAIKYLNATLRRDADFMARFRAEAPGLVELDDPNVVRFYEYVETPTRAAVVMELVDGVSLRTLLNEHRRAGPEAALAVLKGTLLGLASAHERGIAHRDCTPENVLVQADGTSKLADFGLAVHPEEPGAPAGSPAYMAPELWTQGMAGVLADLYAATCVMFECVTGRPPYRSADVPALRDKHLVEPVPVEVVPDAVRGLLRRGLAKDPAGRPRSAREFAAELEEAAVEGFGAEWEKRGRRHLSELATLLALRFPLANPSPSPDRRSAGSLARSVAGRVPRLPPHLWIAGGALAATAIALVISGGRLPGGPGTFLAPPPKTPFELGSTPAESVSRQPARRPTRHATPPPTGTTVPSTPPAVPSTPPRTQAPPTAVPSPTPIRRVAAPPVRAARILTWSGSAGAVRITADGPGPVKVTVNYTRREGEGPSRVVHSESRQLRGRTSYLVPLLYDLGGVKCGERAHFGLMVLTDRVAANGPQIIEVPVDGPACATTTPTPPPAPTETTTVKPAAPTPTDTVKPAAPIPTDTVKPVAPTPTDTARSVAPTGDSATPAPTESGTGVTRP